MKARFEILRRARGASEPRWQRVEIELPDGNATVATALAAINAQPGLTDAEGAPVGRVAWDCSCLQKKCGACAMRINGMPRLACDARLSELGPGPVRLEPLRKYPVVEDLVVDRTAMFDNLRQLHAWLDREVRLREDQVDVAYEASRCLQCGCCLEVCPNFMPGERFAGTAALPPLARLIEELSPSKKEEVYRLYTCRVFEGCGKSLACRDVCPAGIDVERLLVNSNAVAVWKRMGRRK